MKNIKVEIFANGIDLVMNCAGVNCVEEFFMFQNDFCYKRNKYRAVYKIPSEKGRDYFLKKFYRLSMCDFFCGVFKKLSPAMREYRNIKLFEDLGIKTMLPVCLAEKTSCGIPFESFIITESLESFPRVEDFIVKKWKSYSYKKKIHLVKKLAQVVGILHKNNYFHKDLYLGHILFDEEKEEFYVIDLQRVKKHNIVRKRWIIKDLASLNYSAEICDVSSKMRMIFCKEYSRIMDINCRDIIGAVNKKTEKIKKHTIKLLMRKAKKNGE